LRQGDGLGLEIVGVSTAGNLVHENLQDTMRTYRFLASVSAGQVQTFFFPLLVEEGWRVAPGWSVSREPQDHPSATLSRRALLHRRAKSKSFPSSSRRGGAKRRGGRFSETGRDTAAS